MRRAAALYRRQPACFSVPLGPVPAVNFRLPAKLTKTSTKTEEHRTRRVICPTYGDIHVLGGVLRQNGSARSKNANPKVYSLDDELPYGQLANMWPLPSLMHYSAS